MSRVFKLPKSQKLETCEEERAPKNKITSHRRLVPLYSNLLFRMVSNIVEEICFGFLYKVYQHDQPRIYPKVIQISFVLEVEERQENGIRGRLKYVLMSFKRNFITGSSDPSHFIFEINVGNSRIRHTTTLKLNF